MVKRRVLDWHALRQRIAADPSVGYWRSPADAAEDAAADPRRLHEFPAGIMPPLDDGTRRGFLKLMAASLALAGSAGCTEAPDEKIVPYIQSPEQLVPGQPLFFATAMALGGLGVGLVAESHLGRPTRVDGNRRHPASLGATDVLAQASVLTLYDPDRAQALTQRRTISSRDAFLRDLEWRLAMVRDQRGAGLRVLTETITSPTLAWQLARLQEALPEFRWHQYEPVVNDSVLAGAQLAFGEAVQTCYELGQADTVLSLGADFLDGSSWPPAYARHFMDRRRLAQLGPERWAMNRLYVIESTPSATGSRADHRLAVAPGDLVRLGRAIAARLGLDVGTQDGAIPDGVPADWVDAVVQDLKGTPSVVVPGQHQPPEVHLLAHAMNQALGSVGKVVRYRQPVQARPASQIESLRELVQAMRDGEVGLLLILEGNPAFTAPADFGFADALAQVPTTVHLSLSADETAVRCQWHLPALHFLESWSDVRAFDGTASLIQPLMAPLYDAWSPHELLALLEGQGQTSAYDIVRGYWRQQFTGGDFEMAWEQWLRKGIIAGTQSSEKQVSLRGSVREAAESAAAPRPGNSQSGSGAPTPRDAWQVIFRPDPTIWDGRFANNGWLQELPKPITKLTWDNAALISPAAAESLSLANGDLVRLRHANRQIELPVWVVPGQAPRCITLHFGYGRSRVGSVGSQTGFDVFPLRTQRQTLDAGRRGTAESDGQLPSCQYARPSPDGRPASGGRGYVARAATAARTSAVCAPSAPAGRCFALSGVAIRHVQMGHGDRSDGLHRLQCLRGGLPSGKQHPGRGQESGRQGREMHWLRIDTYYSGDLHDPRIVHQPLPCMHCEKAPCEVVCPVAATSHSEEGINEMTYNRCVGTRYCSNNCPYKVRRFNFLSVCRLRNAECSSCCAIPTSQCAAAASWKSAPTASSASTPLGSTPTSRTARSAPARSSAPARPPAPPEPSRWATSIIPRKRPPCGSAAR